MDLITSLPATNEGYIRIVHHPLSSFLEERLTWAQFISKLDVNEQKSVFQHDNNMTRSPISTSPTRPWHPFETEADFTFVEFVKKHRFSNKVTSKLLTCMNTNWTTRNIVMFKNHHDIDRKLNEVVLSVTRVSLNQLWLGDY